MIVRPEPGELVAHYSAYVDELGSGDVEEILAHQGRGVAELLQRITAERLHDRYAPGKWTVAEVIGHITDCERVFTTRLLAFARRDPTPLPGFDQDAYVQNGGFDQRSAVELLREHGAVRAATLAMLPALARDPERQRRTGVANGVTFTVRSIPYVVAGHERHHLDVLRERYRLA